LYALVRGRVGLDDDPVDTERELGAQGRDLLDPGLHLVGRGRRARRYGGVRRGVHAERVDPPQDLAVRPLREPFAEVAGPGQRQGSVREEGHLHCVRAVLGAQRARRAVARIGERLAAVLRAHRVRLLELRGCHEDFAAHLEGGRLGQLAGQPDDGAHRVRHVLARRAVPARDELDEPAVPVAGGDGEAVEFGFDAPLLHRPAESALQGGRPGGELLGGEHIVQRQHRHGVRHVPDRRATGHLPGRGVGQHFVRVRLLVPLDRPHQPVVRVVVQGAVTLGVVGGGRAGRGLDRLGVCGGVCENGRCVRHALHPASHH
jgi:hypothetical protein